MHKSVCMQTVESGESLGAHWRGAWMWRAWVVELLYNVNVFRGWVCLVLWRVPHERSLQWRLRVRERRDERRRHEPWRHKQPWVEVRRARGALEGRIRRVAVGRRHQRRRETVHVQCALVQVAVQPKAVDAAIEAARVDCYALLLASLDAAFLIACITLGVVLFAFNIACITLDIVFVALEAVIILAAVLILDAVIILAAVIRFQVIALDVVTLQVFGPVHPQVAVQRVKEVADNVIQRSLGRPVALLETRKRRLEGRNASLKKGSGRGAKNQGRVVWHKSRAVWFHFLCLPLAFIRTALTINH